MFVNYFLNRQINYISSYRGISVQANVYRVFQSILLNSILIHLKNNFIINKSQYSYSKNVNLSTCRPSKYHFQFFKSK